MLAPRMELAEVCAYALPDQCRIERTSRRDGSTLWAVRQHGDCLNVSGEFECEPQPSSRSDEFLARCRFPTAEAAYACWESACHADTMRVVSNFLARQ